MPGLDLITILKKKQYLIYLKKIKKYKHIPLFRPRKYVKKFEEKFANYIGVKYACCVTSGTAAIKVAVAAGVKKGDEVIMQSFTFVAPVEIIIDIGAKPVLLNVDETLNMCPIERRKK